MAEAVDINEVDELIPTRDSLLDRLKDWSDNESWRVFFETYWRLIYRTASKAGLTDAEAQEVVQETVISVVKSMADFNYQRERGSFKSWLLRLTSWRIRDQLRKRKSAIPVIAYPRKHNPHTSTSTGVEKNIPDPASLDFYAAWDIDWEANLFDAAIARIKKKVDLKLYQIFDLCVFKQWTVSRVARAMDVSPAKVYLAKHRIAKLIKREVVELQTESIKPLLGNNRQSL